MNGPDPSSRVEVMEPLRGFAALAVAWFHFTNGGALVPEGSAPKRSSLIGYRRSTPSPALPV